MDYRLLFTQRALSDLADIVGHIAQDDSEVASRFGNALLDHVDLLTRFPYIGHVTRKRPQVRKLVHTPILVYYQVRDDQRIIEVLHIRHGSRKPPRSELTRRH